MISEAGFSFRKQREVML